MFGYKAGSQQELDGVEVRPVFMDLRLCMEHYHVETGMSVCYTVAIKLELELIGLDQTMKNSPDQKHTEVCGSMYLSMYLLIEISCM